MKYHSPATWRNGGQATYRSGSSGRGRLLSVKIIHRRQGGLTGGSRRSTFTSKGVSDLPRPADEDPVGGVKSTDRDEAVEDGGPIEPFRFTGVICLISKVGVFD